MKKLNGIVLALGLALAACGGDASTSTVKKAATDKTDETEVPGETEAGVSVAISPLEVTLKPEQAQQFTATVEGAEDASVTWEVTEADGGTIDEKGLYTAPSGEGTFHVVATSNADPSQTAQATVIVKAGSVTPPPGSGETVTISPTTATLNYGGTVNFTASIDGTAANNGVTWSATCGTIQNNGNYTAPNAAGSCTVTATSKTDTSAKASATVTVVAPSTTLTVSPTTANIEIEALASLTAYIGGTKAKNNEVTWTVTEANGGTVNPAGNYTAPATPGTYHVTVALVSEPTKKATATITVRAPIINVVIWPTPTSVEVGGSRVFSAAVSSSSFNGLTFSIQEGTAGGYIIANSGFYTAPATPGTYHVVATSTYDDTKKAVATVTVHPITPVINVMPEFPRLETEGTLVFSVSVTNSRYTDWYARILESNGNLNGGSLAGDMLTYTAPSTAGTYTYRVTSAYDASFKKDVSIEVHTPEPYVNIFPTAVTLYSNDVQNFDETVTNTAWPNVTWEIAGNSDADFGTIDGTGNYTAPQTAGTYTVLARSVANTAVTAAATVTVVEPYCPTGDRVFDSKTLGEDGSLFSSDDETFELIRVGYSAYPTQETQLLYSDFGVPYHMEFAYAVTYAVAITEPGKDGIFGTTDDPVATALTIDYDGNGKATRLRRFEAGADGAFFTADDVETGGIEYAWDGAFVRRAVHYVNLGIDGDTVANGEITQVDFFSTFRYVHTLSRPGDPRRQMPNQTHSYSSAGADGEWNLDWNCRNCEDDQYAGHMYRREYRWYYWPNAGWNYFDWHDYTTLYKSNGSPSYQYDANYNTSGVTSMYMYRYTGNGYKTDGSVIFNWYGYTNYHPNRTIMRDKNGRYTSYYDTSVCP